MKMKDGKQIIHVNNGSFCVKDVYCTTYQMRNFYSQLSDGYFSELDIMNYIQHLHIVSKMKKGNTILDVCCGRGLLLPLMRYYAKDISKYVGVDIEESNIKANNVNICNNKSIDPKDWYPFPVEWAICSAAEMSKFITIKFDIVVYTSSIEHMHKDVGIQSLEECIKLIQPGGTLFLTCPVTPEDQNGYDVRYKAHVYEWKISELREVLTYLKFDIQHVYGIVGNIKKLKELMNKQPVSWQQFINPIIEYVPKEFLLPIMFASIPKLSTEVMIVARKW